MLLFPLSNIQKSSMKMQHLQLLTLLIYVNGRSETLKMRVMQIPIWNLNPNLERGESSQWSLSPDCLGKVNLFFFLSFFFVCVCAVRRSSDNADWWSYSSRKVVSFVIVFFFLAAVQWERVPGGGGVGGVLTWPSSGVVSLCPAWKGARVTPACTLG